MTIGPDPITRTERSDGSFGIRLAGPLPAGSA